MREEDRENERNVTIELSRLERLSSLLFTVSLSSAYNIFKYKYNRTQNDTIHRARTEMYIDGIW